MTTPSRISISRTDWLRIGNELFGADPRAWRFKCPACGHEQSHNETKARRADIGDTSGWIYFACEGRHNPGVGCDWSLGGLFQIHTLEVIEESGRAVACMRFADPRADELLTAATAALPQHLTTEASTWAEFVWPDWVPACERELIQGFWSDKYGRAPRDYLSNLRNNRGPIFGSVVTLPKLCRESESVTGRYIHRWNNIGVVVDEAGASQAVSF